MRLTVTGTSTVPEFQANQAVTAGFDFLLAEGYDFTEVSTGAAHGIDTVAFAKAQAYWPKAIVRVCYPIEKAHNYEVVRRAHAIRADVQAVEGGYMDRNDRLVSYADVVAAFPAKINEALRSGTWATVRRARTRDVPILITPLSTLEPFWEEFV
jgi:hypothetical protein